MIQVNYLVLTLFILGNFACFLSSADIVLNLTISRNNSMHFMHMIFSEHFA